MALPPQPPPPGPDSVVLDKFDGLKNTVTRERLKPTELETAINIDIDDVGQIHRRRGYTRVSTANFSSLFTAAGGTVYGVRNTDIGVINPNYTFTSLGSGLTIGAPLDYAQVGTTIYFSSKTASGQIDTVAKTVSPWGATTDQGTWLSPVVNPTATLPAIRGRYLGSPPMATCLTYWNGRIYLGSGNTLWATELYLYNYVDKTKNFMMFESDVTNIGAVTDGIYVTTQDAVWFLSGTLNEMKRIPIMSYGGVPGSMVSVPAELVDPQQQTSQSPLDSKNAVVFMSNSGLCAGLDSGSLNNLTQNDVLFPQAMSIVPLFRRQDGVNSYVGVADGGGSTAARIGDYVDAQIIRFGAVTPIVIPPHVPVVYTDTLSAVLALHEAISTGALVLSSILNIHDANSILAIYAAAQSDPANIHDSNVLAFIYKPTQSDPVNVHDAASYSLVGATSGVIGLVLDYSNYFPGLV